MSRNEVRRQLVQHSDAHHSTSTSLHSALINGTGTSRHLGLQASAQNQQKIQSTQKLPNSFPQSHPHRSRKSGAKGNSSMQPNTTGHSHALAVSFDEEEILAKQAEPAQAQAEPALTVVTWPEHFARFPILAQPSLSWSPKKLSTSRESWSPITEEPTKPTTEPSDRSNPWSGISFPKDPWVSAQPSTHTSNRKKHQPTQETSTNKKRQVGRYKS